MRPVALRAAATYPQRPPRRDVTLTTAVLSLALTHATCLTPATLALALALAALAALALTVPSRTSRPGSSSKKGVWNSKNLPPPPSSRSNWRAHTDAASVSVLSARGRPSRGAGETGSHTTAAGSIPMRLPRNINVTKTNVLAAAQKRIDDQQLETARFTSTSASPGPGIALIHWTRVAPLLRAQAHVEAQRQEVSESRFAVRNRHAAVERRAVGIDAAACTA